MTERLKAAVITEWHPFDVMSFQRLLWSMGDIDFYPQPWDIFTKDPRRGEYDVVLYYNMSFPAPDEGDPRRAYVENELGTTGQGIVLLHHAILSYEHWDAWDSVSGTTDRAFSYHVGQRLEIAVTGVRHPITAGLAPFTITDESYAMAEPALADQVLLTTQHDLSLHSIAWTRHHRSSRVFCYQSGHDDSAWSNESFRIVLHRGLRWAAGRSQGEEEKATIDHSDHISAIP